MPVIIGFIGLIAVLFGILWLIDWDAKGNRLWKSNKKETRDEAIRQEWARKAREIGR